MKTELTIDDQTKTFRCGESYYIPVGVGREASLRAGRRSTYGFAQPAERETIAGDR